MVYGLPALTAEQLSVNRKQVTKIDIYSTLRFIRTDVLQGSTLGPLLFLLYVNEF